MKVSVCIPVHNAAPYVERCARSLLDQGDVELECVFADDFSTDGSADALERVLGEADPARARSVLVRLDRNLGRVGARLAALRHATGDYVGFCDADDWVEPDCYAKLLAAAEREDADAAVCGYCDVAADGSKSPSRRPAALCADPREFVAKSFYSPGFNSLCNKIFRAPLAKTWLQDALPDLCVGEDLWMTMLFLSRAKRLAFVDEPLYCYRKTPSSISREVSRRTVLDMADCLRRIRAAYPDVPQARLDVMRANMLWLALRCRAVSDAEKRALFAEGAVDFSALGEVAKLKRVLLPFLSRHVGFGGALVRAIEGLRGALS